MVLVSLQGAFGANEVREEKTPGNEITERPRA
jgi:hypothetical protein